MEGTQNVFKFAAGDYQNNQVVGLKEEKHNKPIEIRRANQFFQFKSSPLEKKNNAEKLLISSRNNKNEKTVFKFNPESKNNETIQSFGNFECANGRKMSNGPSASNCFKNIKEQSTIKEHYFNPSVLPTFKFSSVTSDPCSITEFSSEHSCSFTFGGSNIKTSVPVTFTGAQELHSNPQIKSMSENYRSSNVNMKKSNLSVINSLKSRKDIVVTRKIKTDKVQMTEAIPSVSVTNQSSNFTFNINDQVELSKAMSSLNLSSAFNVPNSSKSVAQPVSIFDSKVKQTGSPIDMASWLKAFDPANCKHGGRRSQIQMFPSKDGKSLGVGNDTTVTSLSSKTDSELSRSESEGYNFSVTEFSKNTPIFYFSKPEIKISKETQVNLTKEEQDWSSIWKVLECPVCLLIPLEHMLMCSKGHMVCENCKKNLSQCPYCQSKFTQVKNFAAEQIIDLIPLPCKYQAEGCEATVKKIDKKNHELTCVFNSDVYN